MASQGNWPATVTFCFESSGLPVVGYGFVTTYSGGRSSVTRKIPTQTLISTSTGLACAGEVAIVVNGLTTTIELSTLPSATSFLQSTVAASEQVLTQSGIPVIYDIETLSGYKNTQPVLISTSFVEEYNGQTTTQAGWWLIGYKGRIEVPRIGPWRAIGSTWGCIGGPALCDVPCGDIDIGLGFFVHLPLAGCAGQRGPPGWPGGAISGGALPPFPGEAPGEDPGDEGDDDSDETTTTSDEQSTTTTASGEHSTAPSSTQSLTQSSTQISTQSSTQSSALRTQYFLIASPSSNAGKIQAELKLFDPAKGGTYEPNVGDTSVSGGTWIDYQLDANQSAIIASRTDIILVMKCTTVAGFETAPGPTSVFTNVPSAVSFDKIKTEPTATSLGSVGLTVRRDYPKLDMDHKAMVAPVRTRVSRGPEATPGFGARNSHRKRFRDQEDTVADKALQKRDAGTSLVRQVRKNLDGFTGDKYPSDLAVMSWAPGVQSINAGKVDYIFEETKGEDTWVYILDSGVAMNNLVKKPNHSNLWATARSD